MVSFDDYVVSFPPDIIAENIHSDMWILSEVWVLDVKGRLVVFVEISKVRRCGLWFSYQVSFPSVISYLIRIEYIHSGLYIERGLNILLESKALSPSHIAVSCESSISVVAWEGILPFQFCTIFYYMHAAYIWAGSSL